MLPSEEANRKLAEALKLRAKYPEHLELRGLCEEAAGRGEARDWVSALGMLEEVAKLRSRLEWGEVVEEAWRVAQTDSW